MGQILPGIRRFLEMRRDEFTRCISISEMIDPESKGNTVIKDGDMSYNTETYKQLREILRPSNVDQYGWVFTFHSMPGQYDEVYPGILLGNRTGALNKVALKKEGVTHVLNCACGSRFNMINTDEGYYEDLSIKFLGIPAMDFPTYKLNQFFQVAADYIDQVLKHNGKVFVHCQMGVSRSAALVIAFLMLKHRMDVVDAVSTLKSKRDIFPNDGFLKQLCVLNRELHDCHR
ncbi:specificity phosphatase 3-like [Octopus vulgaris]|nr:dual specificity protein phosphatase 3-like isoform X1 [Octopus sinensis]XP_029635918.1 dual specificity protein phosphatase 3-like isoform X1 [Octopus sinensis]XP_036357824.1 dual specificity protein phosphatase 3-like isoform X1 [Octopus sinensis]CAI9721918.1 specificity phosphatase 3-like [Octopus vulgaris]